MNENLLDNYRHQTQHILVDLHQQPAQPRNTATYCSCTVFIRIRCVLDILPCSCACALPWNGEEVDIKAVIREARAAVSCIDLVGLRRTGHEDAISASQESTTVQGLQETKGSIDSGTTVSLGELERTGVVVHVVALAAGYQGVLDAC